MPVHRGEPVDLIAFVQWTYQFLAERSRQLMADPDGDELLSGPSSPALERYRVARAIAAERANSVASRELLPRAIVRTCHEAIAARLRWFGEHLRSSGEDEIADRFQQVLDAAQRDVEKLLDEEAARREQAG